MTAQQRIIGVWDLNKAPSKLGFLLLFMEELLIMSTANEKKVDLVFINNNDIDYQMFSALASFLPCIGSLLFFESKLEFNAFRTSTRCDYDIWPLESEYAQSSYEGSTLTIQKIFKESSVLIPLQASFYIKDKVKRFLQETLNDSMPIAVHLKYNATDTQSNANKVSWSTFFHSCEQEKLSVKFILIGDDYLDPVFRERNNVIVARDFSDSLSFYLGIIQYSSLFMGMSSGFCNMALFSGKPYLIWKHKDHHPEEMEREFQGQPQFPFAGKHQRFIRDTDSEERIISEFNLLYNQLQVGV